MEINPPAPLSQPFAQLRSACLTFLSAPGKEIFSRQRMQLLSVLGTTDRLDWLLIGIYQLLSLLWLAPTDRPTVDGFLLDYFTAPHGRDGSGTFC